ncbi:ABC-2 type transport system permease protein [Psychromicrobium silvestre]|uniref:ABC-2 type transport system permease protein n=1 Tax=Psychromicrobium silvestre TaxID=1645614 RepID=A0A7Y9LTL1_9MICC|nr:ABC transporter permease subunit [Psychromicrobium silvestre]NYE95408.1 ABC-2 type transport system permease protein [Psychromicrobium silvestre]
MTATISVRRAPLPLFSKALADSWRSLIGWALGLSAAMFLYLPLYPSMAGSNSQMQQLLNTLPAQLTKSIGYDDISSGAGWVQATVFGLIGFLLTSIAAISWGASAVGGDEEAGQLELTLAHGVTRTQVVLERYAAMLLRVLLLGVWVFVVIAALNNSAQLSLNLGNLAIGVALFAGLALLSGSAAFMAGALTGRRIWGIGAGAFVAVVGYIFNALGNQSQDLNWLHALSPYSWAYADKPLANGLASASGGWPLLSLYGLAILFALVSVLALRKRDVGV